MSMSSDKKGFVDTEVDSGVFSGENLSTSNLEEAPKSVESTKKIPSISDPKVDSTKIPSQSAPESDSGIIDDSVEDYIPRHLKGQVKIEVENKNTLAKLLNINDDGYSMFHCAVAENLEPEVFDKILSHIHNPQHINIRSYTGLTPLHIAVMMKKHAIIRKLIDAGADLNMRSCSGKNSLHLAVENRDLESAHIILAARNIDDSLLVNLELWNHEGEICFINACRNRDLRMMDLLKSKGADVNAREGKAGFTSLHFAVQSNDMKMVQYFLDAKANLDVENYAGHTSFQMCVLNGNLELANLLRRNGAYPFETRIDSDDDDEMSMDDDIETNMSNNLAGISVN